MSKSQALRVWLLRSLRFSSVSGGLRAFASALARQAKRRLWSRREPFAVDGVLALSTVAKISRLLALGDHFESPIPRN